MVSKRHSVFLNNAVLLFLKFFLIVAFNATSLKAQEQTLNIKLSNASFETFIREVETKTGLTFYYDRETTDSLLVTVDAVNISLETLLDRVLVRYGLRYAISPDKMVFLTKNHSLITELSGVRFVGKISDDTTRNTGHLAHLSDYKGDKSREEIAVENRLFEFGTREQPGRERIFSGYVRDAVTGQPIPQASIDVIGHAVSTRSDQQGYFSISIPEERATIRVSSVGKKDTQRQLLMYASGRLDIEMSERIYSLDEVVVSGNTGGTSVQRTQMGIERLSIATIKQTPTVFGEADVVRVILTLPGVQSVGEAAGGFNVRGGATDQNLVLFNDATIYNPSHFFGFFSAFNPDAVSSIELYKSSIPARFGGRLSSVLDVVAKEGNRNKFSGSGGIGLLTSRLTLEGPVGSKTSFLVGGRSTYSDWLLKLIPDESYENSSAAFYDGNFQLTHDFNEKNSLYLMGYLSHDRFSLGKDTSYAYQNASANIKWKRVLNDRFHTLVSAGMDRYQFAVKNTNHPVTSYDLDYGITQQFFKIDLHHHMRERHRLLYGVSTIRYMVQPGGMLPLGADSEVVPNIIQEEHAVESAVHITDVYQVSDRLTLDVGLRYSMFNFLGSGRADVAGSTRKTYHAPEIRFAARYLTGANSSLKVGYNSLNQYIHMLSNTTAMTPTDTWKLSDQHIKPQSGDQLSLGFYQNFNSDRIETSVEVYYKRIKDYLDYKGGARLLMNHHIEEDVIGTEGQAYGVEFMIKKMVGRLNGWFSYTYSSVRHRTVDAAPGDMINGGAYYPGNHDKPHNLTLVGNYKFSHRLSFSLNGTYSTGRPITLPIARYYYAGAERVFYSQRNQYRTPDFFRVDASFNIEGNHKVRKLAHSSWTVGVYNVTGRKNAFSVFYLSEPQGIKGYKLSIFGHQIPFVTYNFKF